MATYTWEQWRLQGSGWSTTYTASADVTVTRNYGDSNATLSISATMTTQSGDSNTLGWKCWIQINGTWESFDVASQGAHYAGTSKSATQIYSIPVGDSAGTLTGGIKFQICGFSGYTGEYSPENTYSLAYGSKGPTELTSVSNKYYGSATTFTLSRKASNLRENITMASGSTTLTIKTTSDSSTTFTYTLDRSYTPTTAFPSSSNWTITVSTYDGSTLIGTNTYTHTWSISNSDVASYAPTLTTEPTCQAYNDVVSALSTDTAVAGYSKINVRAAKTAVSLKYSATISSRVVTFGNGSTASSDSTNHYSSKIMTAGAISWTYVVTDSRGLTVTRSGTYNVINANAPVITATVYRGDSGGTAQDGGPYIFVTASATYDSLNNHNSVTLKANVNGGTDVTLTSGTRATLKTDAAEGTTYTVNVKATDILQTTQIAISALAADVPFNVRVGGKGVGIGTKADEEGYFKVGYKMKLGANDVGQLTPWLAQGLSTQIPQNANLNSITYLKVGTYYVPNGTIASSLTNCPTTNGFTMTVSSPIAQGYNNESTGTWIYRVRTLIDATGNEWRQAANSNGTAGNFTYGSWVRIYSGAMAADYTEEITNQSVGTTLADTSAYVLPTSAGLYAVTATAYKNSSIYPTEIVLIRWIPPDTSTIYVLGSQTYSTAFTSQPLCASALVQSTGNDVIQVYTKYSGSTTAKIVINAHKIL